MKESLKLLPIFIIMFLVVYLLFSAFAFIFQWMEAAPHSPGEAFGHAAANLPAILLQVLPAAVIFSTFALLFFRRSRRRTGIIVSLLVLILSSAIYGGLFYYLSGLEPPAQTERAFPPMQAQQLQRFADTMLYTEELLPDERGQQPLFQMTTVLAVSMNRDQGPYMALLPSATANPLEGTITFPDDRSAISYRSEAAAGVTDLQPPRLLSGFLGEIGAMVSYLQQALDTSLLLFGVAVVVQVLWAVSAWGLVRISSWPLFNALLALFAFRGLFFLWETFRSDIVLQTVSSLLKEPALPFVPAGAFLLLSLLMLAWSSLVSPQREEG